VSDKNIGQTELVKWRRAEFVLNWEDKEIKYYHHKENDKDYITSLFYYQELESVNGLMIYNLKNNTVSYIKDIIVDDEIPPGRLFSNLIAANASLISFLLAIFILSG
jgi:hypothetical protein